MARHALAVFLVVVLFTVTQGFPWGRVFNNDKNTNRSNERDGLKPSLPEVGSAMTREETEVAERPLTDSLHEEREKSFRGARSEEEHEEDTSVGGFDGKKSVRSEEKSRGRVEAVSAGSTSTDKEVDAELHSLQKEVSDIRQPLGPDMPPERVEVVGLPREHEHHITDGLADAIAGLMRVYNTLVRSDGRDWDRSTHGSVHLEKAVGKDGMKNSTAEEKADGESVRAADKKEAAKGGLGPIGALAGVAVVAGVGVALVGFRQRERESPVYPPRGPAYV